MPTNRDNTPTLEQLYSSYTPGCLTERQWRALASDVCALVRATAPAGYWRARDLLSTACGFIKTVSPSAELLSVDEVFTYTNVGRHRISSTAAGRASASLSNERSRLNTLVKAHLGLRQAGDSARELPLTEGVYQSGKAGAQRESADALTGRRLLKTVAGVLSRTHPGTPDRALRTRWALDMLSAPLSLAEIVRVAELNRTDFELACPHLLDVDVDITALRDGR